MTTTLSMWDRMLLAHGQKVAHPDATLFLNTPSEVSLYRTHTTYQPNYTPDIPIEIMAYTLAFWQKEKVVDILQASTPETPEADLVAHIVAETKVEQVIAEAYVKSYRFNKQGGSIARMISAVESDRAVTPDYTPKKVSVRTPDGNPIATEGAAPTPNANGGIVAQILALHEEGKSVAEIIQMGYNKSTVYRQVGEYKKRKAAGK